MSKSKIVNVYPEYMEDVRSQLQASLNRHMTLGTSSYYGSGSIEVKFGLARDGSISYCIPIEEDEDKMHFAAFAEKIVRDAAPFQRLTDDMVGDERLQQLSVRVNLR